MKHLIVVNGPPRVGKDTAIAEMKAIAAGYGYKIEEFSSIDPVREALIGAGIDVSKKTPADRKLLAAVGDCVEEHSDFRTKTSVARATSFFAMTAGTPAIFFLHMREPKLIDKVRFKLETHPWIKARLHTVLVSSIRRGEQPTNATDRGVHDMAYDVTVNNDDDHDHLANSCNKALRALAIIP